uniref:NAD(P) transhydrogenase subunit beta n=1 Tax=Acetithermum autotrophicum TaxID=1446466 RepID=H5ST62_ACEAU|nr:NAD(P) transhydrogenase subunit beta [Candidatus Acetothermum autotrophicum]
MSLREVLIALAYMVASACFVIGLMWLQSPKRARMGNLLSSVGMLVAIIATLFVSGIKDYSVIIIGVILGSALGAVMAYTVKMTAMPQMVGILNGFGGGASALVAAAEFFKYAADPSTLTLDVAISIMLAMIVGAVTFSGSMIAAGKLQGVVNERPITYPFQNIINLIFFLTIVAAAVFLVINFGHPWVFLYLTIAALIFGVLFTIPIGGADMPVVICFLNALSGIAAAMAGFVIKNNALIIAGSLVGASGVILTQIMCWAMNRPITNVLFGAFGAVVTAGSSTATATTKTVKPIQPDEAAILLAYAQLVIIVPGYGMAVSQAQHAVRQLADELQKRGVTVKYAIHPVAGRMPGHMNVLLAEANVPYDQLYDMDQINDEFQNADVALIVGANDVVNPAARYDKSSPIYGMPILNADHAKQIIVLKRSMNPGFAGIENELFYNEKTRMLFGDAKESLTKLINEVKNV